MAQTALESKQPGFFSLIVLSGWCGLVAGLLEVATIVVRKAVFDDNHLYGMSRHFVWLIPATNLGLFLLMGLAGWLVIRACQRLRLVAGSRDSCAQVCCCRRSWSLCRGSTHWLGWR